MSVGTSASVSPASSAGLVADEPVIVAARIDEKRGRRRDERMRILAGLLLPFGERQDRVAAIGREAIHDRVVVVA